MKFVLRNVGDVKIAELGANLNGSVSVDILFEQVLRPNLKLLIDMGNVRKVSPAALRQLDLQKRITEGQGVEIRLLNVGKISDPKTLTQLGLLFPTYDDEAQAVLSFARQ
jgi:hypothetical protein